jgi:hypothetical protein
MEEAVIENKSNWIINDKDPVLFTVDCGIHSLLGTASFESMARIKREFNLIRNPHHKVRIEGVAFFIDSLWKGQEINILVDGIKMRTITSDFFSEHYFEVCGNAIEHDRLFYFSFEMDHSSDTLLLEFVVPNYSNQRWGILKEVNLTAIGFCKVNSRRNEGLSCVSDRGYYQKAIPDSPFSGFNNVFSSLTKICPALCLTCTSEEQCGSCILPALAPNEICAPHSSSKIITYSNQSIIFL